MNKALAAAAAPFLFEVIPVWIGVRSLERLTTISEHPQLSQYPKQIIFSPIRFIDYQDDSLYEDQVKDWIEHFATFFQFSRPYHGQTYVSIPWLYRSTAPSFLEVFGRQDPSKAFSHLPQLEILNVTVNTPCRPLLRG